MQSLGVLPTLLLLFVPTLAESADEVGSAAEAFGVSGRMELPGATKAHRDMAKAVGKEVVCLCGTCPKRLVTDCDCGWAKEMQRVLLNAVVQGKKRDEILTTYQKVYGGKGLAMPPSDDQLAKVAWLLPYGASIFGLALAFYVGLRILRRTRELEARKAPGSRSPEDDASSEAEQAAREELRKELEDLD